MGFSSGHLSVISTLGIDSLKQEVYNGKIYEKQLYDMSFSPVCNKLATCGDNCVKILNVDDWVVELELLFDQDTGIL